MTSRVLSRRRAFTLMELLIVVGLIGAMTIAIAVTLTGGGKSVALEAGQATLVQLVTSARSRALAANSTVRLLVRNRVSAEDYRRLIVVVQNEGEGWRVRESFVLPRGVYLLPYRTRIPSGMYAVASDWRNAANSEVLGSSALNSALFSFDYDSGIEQWEYVGFTNRGTMETGQGSLIVAAGRAVAPTMAEVNNSPIVMTDPQATRGVQLSTYGQPRLINDRTGF